MDEDDPWSALAQKAQLLQTLIAPLSSSTSKLSHKSRAVPHDKDFHFYNNFPDFKLPAKEILSVTHSSLDSLSSSSNFFGSKTQPPFPSDPDESYDWLVNLNDDLVERFNLSLDEFKAAREKAEGKGGSLELEEGGFQVVNNRRKKKGSLMEESQKDEVKVGLKEKKALGVKSKVPFHIPTIRRPQDEFNILVNNVNKPFEHVWLEKSEDGSRFVHPLEKLSISDFIDRSIQKDEIVKPLPIETTPFKLVEAVKDLKELAAKLRDVNEFAVDLEHNQYRSFQGLTCLMQISTRTEDFIIDTLKLRVHIGPYLREVFRDPSKRKVMHGADRDIEWLQRDFGIYICNLFDTGQASRVMQLERNSLEFLLHHFCEVSANKEYQNADWRLRPLPDEMLKYAREDTHYLLYIYDVMRSRLLLSSSDEEDLLLEVYKRSYDVCIHLYEKELLTDTSFLHLYGRLQEADFNSRQLAVADGLYKWRDRVARDEDESTGYILPNKTLLEIAKQMPVSHGKLRWLVKSKHTAVDQHLNNVIMIIKRAIEKSSDYEGLVEQLKARLEEKAMQKLESGNNSQIVLDTEEPIDAIKDAMDDVQLDGEKNSSGQITSGGPQQMDKTSPMSLDIGFSPEVSHSSGTVEEKRMDNGRSNLSLLSNKASTASVQIMKKQTCAFGALLGNSASRRKSNPSIASIGYNNEQDKNVNKVEQIRSKVTLPFHSFSGEHNSSEPNPPEIIKQAEPETHPQHSSHQSYPTELEEVIKLENNESDTTQSSAESPDDGEIDTKEESTSLSNISSSFEECFQSISQIKSSRNKNKRPSQEEPEVNIQVNPFDYATARINFNFGGEGGVSNKTDSDSREGKGSASWRANREEKVRGLRRQAFPPTGNRSATYK